MEKSTLVKLMETLSPKELDDFEKYISGRYEKSKVQVDLFLHLRKYLVNTSCKQLTKEYISKYIIKGADNKRIGTEASRIHKWLEDFLILQHLESKESKAVRLELLVEMYEHRKNLTRRDELIKKLLQNSNKEAAKEAADYWQLSQLYEKQYVAAHKSHMRSNKSSKDILVASQENLEMLYALRSLQYKCEFLCRNQIFSENTTLTLPALEPALERIPAIKNYHLHAQLLDSLDIEMYYDAKNYLFTHLNNIHVLDAKRCFGYLLNVLARLIRSSKEDYTSEVFELYKKGIAHDLLLNNEIISSIRFNNILGLAAVHNDLDWANDFIEQYKKYLDKEERHVTVILAKSSILFEQGEIGKAVDLLNSKKQFSIGNEFRRRLLLISCHVELSSPTPMIEDMMNAFSSFISDKEKLNKSMQAGARNYISILKKLLKEEATNEDIKSQLHHTKEIYMKSWLQEKINQYKKRF